MSASFRRTDLEQHTLRSRLCVLWLLGLLLGCLAAVRPGACPAVQWHADSSPWPCIGRLLLELLCAAAASWGLPSGACSAVVFCRAAAFGYTAQGIQVCFGSAGWLLWPLMLWPQLLFFPFLFYLLSGRRGAGAYLVSAAAAIGIGFADHQLVMPFLAFLIE